MNTGSKTHLRGAYPHPTRAEPSVSFLRGSAPPSLLTPWEPSRGTSPPPSQLEYGGSKKLKGPGMDCVGRQTQANLSPSWHLSRMPQHPQEAGEQSGGLTHQELGQTPPPAPFSSPSAPTAGWRWGAGTCMNLGYLLEGWLGALPSPSCLYCGWAPTSCPYSWKMTSPLVICSGYQLMNQSMGWGQTELRSIDLPQRVECGSRFPAEHPISRLEPLRSPVHSPLPLSLTQLLPPPSLWHHLLQAHPPPTSARRAGGDPAAFCGHCCSGMCP